MAFLDFELWDIGTGKVSPLPSSPAGNTPLSSAISPDGQHIVMAWTTDEGVLQVGVAQIDDLMAADGEWRDDAWSVATLADNDPLGDHTVVGRRPVCWCGDHVVVIARDKAYTLDLEATTEVRSSHATTVPG